jgi:hypothetical protein
MRGASGRAAPETCTTRTMDAKEFKMPKTLGRPKGSQRCHPRKVTIKMPLPHGVSADPEKLADLRATIGGSIDRVSERMKALAGDADMAGHALTLPRADEGDVTAARVAGLLASGANPELILAALKDLRRQVSSANPDSSGALAFTASSQRGADGAPSSADLAAALGLVCVDAAESSWVRLPVGPSAFLAAAPTAKSYARTIARIPETLAAAERAADPAARALTEQGKLVEQYEFGDITLQQLVEQDLENMREAKEEFAARVRAASVMLTEIPAGTEQYYALSRVLERSVEEGWAQLQPLYPSLQEAERSVYGLPGEDDPGMYELPEGEDDDPGMYGPPEEDYDPGMRHYDTLRYAEGLRDSRTPASVSACYPEALLDHVDLYVSELHQSESDGNRAAARQMADLLAAGIVGSDDTMRRIRDRGVFRDWNGVDRVLDGSAASEWERRENITYGLDFLEDTLPWIHDFSGPYVAATLPPAAYALAEHLDRERSAELVGASRFPDGWQAAAAQGLMDRYGMRRADAERQVARAEEHLFPRQVPDGEDSLVYSRQKAPLSLPRESLAQLPAQDRPHVELVGKDGRRWRIEGQVAQDSAGHPATFTTVKDVDTGEFLLRLPTWDIAGGMAEAVRASLAAT